MSNVGGGAPVVPVLANSDVGNLGLAPAAPDDVAFSLGGPLGMSATSDTDRFFLESEILASPNSSTLDDDYMACDNSFQQDFDLFDINDFFNDEANTVATDSVAAGDFGAANPGLEHKLSDSENQIPSSNPHSQPLLGASSRGCDVGGIAVGL